MLTRRGIGLLVAAIALVGAAVAPAAVRAAVPNYSPPDCPRTLGISRVAIQPTNSGTLQVARVAAAKAGASEKWDLKADLWFCNRSATSYFYVTTKIEFLNASSVVTKTLNTRPFTYSDSNGNRVFYKLPANTTSVPLQAFVRPGEPTVGSSVPTVFDYPLPAKIRFKTTFKTSSGASTAITNTVSVPVANQGSPGPLNGFFFPESQVSLPAGAYFFQTYHDDLNLHNRYALDIGAMRFDNAAGSWTQYRAYNASNPGDPANNHHLVQSWLIYGAQVRAMSDGEVISCVRGDVDNQPYIVDGHVDPVAQGQQQYEHPGGNYLWVRTGNQTQVYAHLKYLSIPFSLCPYSDNQEHKLADPYSDAPGDGAYQIRQGQVLGVVGNSGNTSNPHTHVESIMGTSEIYGGSNSEFGYGSDSRPMNFINVRVQAINWSAPPLNANWNELASSRVIPANSLISANDCGFVAYPWVGKAEVVQAGTTASCWAQMYNTMLQAGLRPVHYDSHPDGTSRTITTVWRRADGTAWVLLHGLTSTGLQNAHNTYTAAGWRYLNLQSYKVNGAERYAVIFVQQPGATQFARADMSLTTFTTEFNARTAAGYRMVDYSVVVLSGVPRYTGLWVYAPTISSYVVKDVSAANYQNEFVAQTSAGRMPVSLDGYELNGVTYLSTIWYGSQNSWVAAHGMTKSQVGANETTNIANRLFARAITEYGFHTFAGVWRSPPNTSIGTKPPSSTNSTTASFSFTAPNDQMSTFECKLDSGSWAACTSPKNYSGLTHTTHTFTVRARDFQGLRDLSPASYTWTIN